MIATLNKILSVFFLFITHAQMPFIFLCLVYFILSILITAILTIFAVFIVAAGIGIIFFAPRWGQTNVVVYVFICSTLGALTVMGVKGMGVAIRQTIEGEQQFTNWLTYVMLVVVIIDILFQLHFLNKALDTFNTAVVTPTYYVLFNTAVAICSLTLFNEFEKLTVYDIIGEICGFFVIVNGIFMLNAFKDMDITLRNLPKASKPSEEIEVEGGSTMEPPQRDNDLVLNIRENESEDELEPEAESLMGCHDSPVYVHESPMDSEGVEFKVPKRRFFGNGSAKSNGHVEHLQTDVEKNVEEVTHF